MLSVKYFLFCSGSTVLQLPSVILCDLQYGDGDIIMHARFDIFTQLTAMGYHIYSANSDMTLKVNTQPVIEIVWILAPIDVTGDHFFQ